MSSVLGPLRRMVVAPSFHDVSFAGRRFPVTPTDATRKLEAIPQAVVCGFEWGIDLPLLWDSRVSRPVADTIDGLCSGSFSDVRQALRYLHKHAVKRRPTALQPVAVAAAPRLELEPPPPPPTPVAVVRRVAAAPRREQNDEILPPSRPKPTSLWRRLFGR